MVDTEHVQWGCAMIRYICDGPGCKAEGEPRGKSSTLPVGWVCVAGDGKVLHLCMRCELERRRRKGDKTCDLITD